MNVYAKRVNMKFRVPRILAKRVTQAIEQTVLALPQAVQNELMEDILQMDTEVLAPTIVIFKMIVQAEILIMLLTVSLIYYQCKLVWLNLINIGIEWTKWNSSLILVSLHLLKLIVEWWWKLKNRMSYWTISC